MTHIIDIPVLYDAEVIFKGGRKQRMVKLFDIMPFELDCVDEKNAPLIAEITYDYDYRNIYFREIDGMVFQSYGNYDLTKNVKKIELIPEDIITKHMEVKNVPGYFVNNFRHLNNNVTPNRMSLISEDVKLRMLISNNKNKSVSEMNKFIGSMKLIDGMLYKKMVGEPCIELNVLSNGLPTTNLSTQNYSDSLTNEYMTQYRPNNIPIPLYGYNHIKNNNDYIRFHSKLDCSVFKPELFSKFDMNITYSKIINIIGRRLKSYLSTAPGHIPRKYLTNGQMMEFNHELSVLLSKEVNTLNDVNDICNIVNRISEIESVETMYNVLGHAYEMTQRTMMEAFRNIQKQHDILIQEDSHLSINSPVPDNL